MDKYEHLSKNLSPQEKYESIISESITLSIHFQSFIHWVMEVNWSLMCVYVLEVYEFFLGQRPHNVKT